MKGTLRLGLVHASLALFMLAILAQAVRVQILQGDDWMAAAHRQQYTNRPIPAPRGLILDAAGEVLAQSRQVVRLEVAPREVRDAERLRTVLTRVGAPAARIARALDRRHRWVRFPRPFLAVDIAPLLGIAGVHATPMVERSYAMSTGTRGLIGRVDADNNGIDGLELSLDSLLRGSAGSEQLARDVQRRTYDPPGAARDGATPGHTVVLTLHHDLQEIAENALATAVARNDADGGDIVVLDAHSGEVLALASVRAGGVVPAATALIEPFEAGSTIKPFIAAALVQRGRVGDADSVDIGVRELELEGRVIHDEHVLGRSSLADVIQWSSNIGIVRFAERLTPGEQYEALRDFGFGTTTGVPFPSEAAGRLMAPRHWSRQSAASMSMGYEIAVTPLQLATAYAAFANGGKLLEPALVKEIRSPSGGVVFRHTPRTVRQVLSPRVADKIRRMLLGVVEDGTAVQADLLSYAVAGKTGTPRATVNGRYRAGNYNPNFVGLFPGDAPQIVIVVKMSNPRTSYFAATTAAPLTRDVLQAAVAARDAALDRRQLAVARRAPSDTLPRLVARQSGSAVGIADGSPAAVEAVSTPARDSVATRSFVFPVPVSVAPAPDVPTSRPVPDVSGLPLRDAVRSLHKAGFRVRLVRAEDRSTSPAAGSVAPAGSLVRLSYDF